MTLTEIQDIFAQAEVMFVDRTAPLYQYYLFTDTHRSGGVVDPKNLVSLISVLENYEFKEYAPGQVPVFVEKKTTIIQGN